MLSLATQNRRFTPESLVAIIVLHVLSLGALWTFSWAGLIAFLVMTVVTGCLGITLGFHRLLTHRSFQTSKALTYVLAFCGCLALQGGPICWVATHRLHHKEADKPKDPHSSEEGFWWSHLMWNFYVQPELDSEEKQKRLAPDIYQDQVLRFMDRYFLIIYLGFAAALFLAGTLFQGLQLGLSLVFWGCILRLVYVWHITWLVNSATHFWGYQTFASKDKSLNNWWVALLTFGEGWHNNHHAHPRSARMGFAWFEIDITYWLILVLKRLRLVSNITTPRPSLPQA